MLLRGQNLLGYRHYEDDVVEHFVDRPPTTAWMCSASSTR
jgi:pyruvate/oxaloacetate carboxyltransferase